MAALTWSTISGASISRSATDFVAGTHGAAATDGMQLSGVGAFAVYVVADSGQTITAAGGATAYVQDPHSGLWGRAEIYDIAAGTVTGVRQVLAGAFKVEAPCGRIAYVNNGFTTSSGTLTLRLVATAPNAAPYGGMLL